MDTSESSSSPTRPLNGDSVGSSDTRSINGGITESFSGPISPINIDIPESSSPPIRHIITDIRDSFSGPTIPKLSDTRQSLPSITVPKLGDTRESFSFPTIPKVNYTTESSSTSTLPKLNDTPESSSGSTFPTLSDAPKISRVSVKSTGSFFETEDHKPKIVKHKQKINIPVREDVNEVLKGLKSWSFDIFELKNDDLPKMVEKIFDEFEIFNKLPLDRAKFSSFVTSIQGQYRGYVPYHNFRHACDVLHATYLILTLEEAREKFNDLETFALLLAALCHDVDHPGLNNGFLSATNDPLAIRYNDISVLESHHASTTMKTMLAYEATNILESFSQAEQRYIRKIMITAILATDMDQHFRILHMLKDRNSNPNQFKMSPPYEPQHTNYSLPDGVAKTLDSPEKQDNAPLVCSADCSLLLQMIIKCADISNVMKPFSLSKRWAALLATEWFRQGESERKLGLPVSKHMDPENPSPLQVITLGCIDFIANPMYESMAVMLPRFKAEILVNLKANQIEWTRFNSPNPTQQVVSEILECVDPQILHEIHLKPQGTHKTGTQKHLSHIQKISFNRQNRTNNARGRASYSSGDHKDNDKQVERPLSLLLSAPEAISSFLRSRPSGARSDHGASSSSPRNSEYSAPLKVQDLVSKGALHENRLIGNGKMFPHPDKGIQSLELVSKSFSLPFDSAADEKNTSRDRNPLAIHIPPNDFSFWKILRAHPHAIKLNQFMDSKFWALLIVPAVFISLFCYNMIKTFFPKSADPCLIPIYLVCLSLFTFEIVVLSVVRKDYFLGLSFWLDVVGSVTLIPLLLGMLEINLIMARTAEAAKSFTKAAKWMQTVDLSKTIIISSTKFLKHRYTIKHADMSKETDFDSEYQYKGKPSQVWTRLSELTTQKLVLGMLLVVVLIPNFRVSLEDHGPVASINALDHSPLYTDQFNSALDDIFRFYETHGYKLLYLSVKTECVHPVFALPSRMNIYDDCPILDPLHGSFNQIFPSTSVCSSKHCALAEYRDSELLRAVSDSGRSEAYFSIKQITRKKLQYDMATTIIILVILSAWSYFLSWDSNKLLIQPIERMVRFVKELADDPVSFAGKMMPPVKGGEGKAMETRVVEAALIKIARLTKVALGDAGMDILSVNLKGTAFNPMIPGKKIRACFGFCDIRNFTDATECLQEDVMVFVNKIAELVHNKVIAYHGYPNKNIGDAFLLVWKKTFSDVLNKKRGSSYADSALRSFLDIIYSIETSQTLQAYAMHPDIQRRMPGYRIRLGFGLHVGWAIEGAIGSSHKVDPSYLSPHVNMASRLEAATKQYGVPLLLSETVVSNLTKSSLRDSCRKIDRITVKGSKEPMMLYTYDMPMFQQDLLGNYKEYKEAFEEAVEMYIDGEWHGALEKLQVCLVMWPTDFPIRVLINFMGVHKNMVPEDWKGYRELHEK